LELKRTGTPLPTIAGNVPSLKDLPKGCAFANRCDYAIDACRQAVPPLAQATPTQKSRCIRWQEL
jgi:peptide/nickel transport system ATP-binding protein